MIENKNEMQVWLARDEDGWLGLWTENPKKNNRGEWYSNLANVKYIDGNMFPSVKETDEEPTEAVIRLK